MSARQEQAEVLVVGGGMGGLTAAIQASSQGARTVLLEKYPDLSGSNVARSGGALNVQVQPYGPYTPEELVAEFIKTSDGNCDVALVRTFAHRIAGDLQWLLEEIKLPTEPQAPRGYPRAIGGGCTIPPHLFRLAQERGVRGLFNTRALGLLTADGSVRGVQARTPQGLTDFSAGAVVLATGGFESNGEMVLRYLGSEVHSTAFCHRAASPSHTGDGQLMAMAVGAGFGVYPLYIHCRPEDRSFVAPGVRPISSGPIRELRRSHRRALWVNREGRRFIDESNESGPISTAIMRQPGGVAALIFDEAIRQMFPEEAQSYEEKMPGIFIRGDSLEELAQRIGIVPAERLRATVQEFNGAIKDRRALDLEIPKGHFGPWAHPIQVPPYYAVYPVYSSLNTVWGGLSIDPEARVLDRDGAPIPGLYAAGAIFGGVFYGRWGQTPERVWVYNTNYHLQPSSLPICLTFGRIAGRNASLYSQGVAQ